MYAFIAISAAVFVVDHLTKLLAIKFLMGQSAIPIVPGCLNLAYAENTGAAFSMLESRPALLMLLATCALVAIVFIAVTTPPWERAMRIGFALMIGGAVANLVDRYFRGHVVDFIDAYLVVGGDSHHWPTFNIADSAICIGTGLVILRSFLMSDKDPNAEPEADAEENAPSAE